MIIDPLANMPRHNYLPKEIKIEFIKQFKEKDLKLRRAWYRDDFIGIEYFNIEFNINFEIYSDTLKISLEAITFSHKKICTCFMEYNDDWEIFYYLENKEQIPEIINKIYNDMRNCYLQADCMEVINLVNTLKVDFTKGQLSFLNEILEENKSLTDDII